MNAQLLFIANVMLTFRALRHDPIKKYLFFVKKWFQEILTFWLLT